MRNKLLEAIFPDREDTSVADQLILPVAGESLAPSSARDETDSTARTNAVASAFSELILPTAAGATNNLQTGATVVTTSASNSKPAEAEVFNELSRKLEQLRVVSEAQTAVLGSNTAAITSNTAAKGVAQTIASAGKTAGGLLGGLTALPLISGIFKLFGGGGSPAQPTLTKYTEPTSVQFDEVLKSDSGSTIIQNAEYDSSGKPRIPSALVSSVPNFSPILASVPQTNNDIGSEHGEASTGNLSTGVSRTGAEDTRASSISNTVNVNIHAMDSRSILDRSQDIAQAVREAMLNMHSINDVVNDL